MSHLYSVYIEHEIGRRGMTVIESDRCDDDWTLSGQRLDRDGGQEEASFSSCEIYHRLGHRYIVVVLLRGSFRWLPHSESVVGRRTTEENVVRASYATGGTGS